VTCSMYETKGNYVQNVFGKPKDRDHFECPGVEDKTGRGGLKSSGSGQSSFVGGCEYCNELRVPYEARSFFRR